MNVCVLRWPDRALSPNTRVHYMTRHRAVSNYRTLTAYEGRGQKRLQNPVCCILPLVATNRRRDLDNVLASLKSALDGLTDAGWWKDDHDIVGFHLLPELYSKLWVYNKILIVSANESDVPAMNEEMTQFKARVLAGEPNQALAELAKRNQ